MKIALITDGIFPYVIGGMQKHSYYVAKYLARKGVYVDLYHMPDRKDFDITKLEFFTEEEKRFIRSFVIAFPPKGTLPGHYLRESYIYSERIFRVLKENLAGVDFIYVKGFAGWKLLEEKTKGMKLPPVGIKFHGLNMFQKPPSFRGRLEGFMFRSPVMYNIRAADYVFSYGGKITEITRKIGVPDERIMEVPTGMEEPWIRISPITVSPVRKFVYVGRYERLKGIEELSIAIKQLIPKRSFEFHFIGSIPEGKKIRSGKVFYHGTIADPEKLKAHLDAMDILVLPSYSEGMPNAIIEGMSRGTAIIATDVGAVKCLVSTKNGWLLGSSTVRAIREGMENALMISSEELSEKKRFSHQFASQKLLWEQIAEKLISALSSVTGRK